MLTVNDIKRFKAAEREQRMANGHRSTATQTILSRKDKDADPRRQRKSKSWQKEALYA